MKKLVFAITLLFSAQLMPVVGHSASHLVVISGLGGEPFYSDLFYRWSTTLIEVARQQLGLPAENVHYLAEDPNRNAELISGRSTREEILATLASVATSSDALDNVMVVFVGHGSASRSRALLNVPGPDLDATALRTALDEFGERTIALVNTAPSSSAFVDHLSAPNRIIVTATASSAENQHTHFGGFFAGAFAESAADANKDRQISLFEAFVYAKNQTERFFEDEDRVLTEHAQLDDNGDARATRNFDNEVNSDGTLARQFTLAGSDVSMNTETGRKRLRLNIAAKTLVDRIETLKRNKRTLTSAEYVESLEALLVELALNRREARETAQ